MIKSLRTFLILFLSLYLSSCSDEGDIVFNGQSFSTSSTNVIVNGGEIPSQISVVEDQMMKLTVNRNITSSNKYRVLMRVDPRYSTPQMSIYKIDNAGVYRAVNAINVSGGDVISMKIVSKARFFDSSIRSNSNEPMKGELLPSISADGSYYKIDSGLTESGKLDNAIIYTSNVTEACKYSNFCVRDANGITKFKDNLSATKFILGNMQFVAPEFSTGCDLSSTDTSKFCKYNLGAGFEAKVGGQKLKNWNNQFLELQDDSGAKNIVYSITAPADGIFELSYPAHFTFNDLLQKVVVKKTPQPSATYYTVEVPCEQLSSCTGNLYYNGMFVNFDCCSNNLSNLLQPSANLGNISINDENGNRFTPDSLALINAHIKYQYYSFGEPKILEQDNQIILVPKQSGDKKYTLYLRTWLIKDKGPPIISYEKTNYLDYMQANWTSSIAANNFASVLSSLGVLSINKVAAGRYFFEIEVGAGDQSAIRKDSGAARLYYIIRDRSGNIIGNKRLVDNDILSINAPASGFLHFIAESDDPNLTGYITVGAKSFTSSVVFSKFMDERLVKPLTNKMLYITGIIFSQMTQNMSFRAFLSAALTLYLLIFGIMFAIGAVDVTVKEWVTRCIKILLVSALLSRTSWSFFYQYLFKIFIDGADQLVNNVSSSNTAIVGTVFGYVDPILNKFLSRELWYIIFIYWLHGYKGYMLVGYALIGAAFKYLRVVIGIFVGYIMAFFNICVLIILGPLFMISLLFEKTKDMFDKWIIYMAGAALQPTIMVIFLMLLEQISGEILSNNTISIRYSSEAWRWFLFLPIYLFPGGAIAGYIPQDEHVLGVIKPFLTSITFFCIVRVVDQVSTLASKISDTLLTGGQPGPSTADKYQGDITNKIHETVGDVTLINSVRKYYINKYDNYSKIINNAIDKKFAQMKEERDAEKMLKIESKGRHAEKFLKEKEIKDKLEFDKAFESEKAKKRIGAEEDKLKESAHATQAGDKALKDAASNHKEAKKDLDNVERALKDYKKDSPDSNVSELEDLLKSATTKAENTGKDFKAADQKYQKLRQEHKAKKNEIGENIKIIKKERDQNIADISRGKEVLTFANAIPNLKLDTTAAAVGGGAGGRTITLGAAQRKGVGGEALVSKESSSDVLRTKAIKNKAKLGGSDIKYPSAAMGDSVVGNYPQTDRSITSHSTGAPRKGDPLSRSSLVLEGSGGSSTGSQITLSSGENSKRVDSSSITVETVGEDKAGKANTTKTQELSQRSQDKSADGKEAINALKQYDRSIHAKVQHPAAAAGDSVSGNYIKDQPSESAPDAKTAASSLVQKTDDSKVLDSDKIQNREKADVEQSRKIEGPVEDASKVKSDEASRPVVDEEFSRDVLTPVERNEFNTMKSELVEELNYAASALMQSGNKQMHKVFDKIKNVKKEIQEHGWERFVDKTVYDITTVMLELRDEMQNVSDGQGIDGAKAKLNNFITRVQGLTYEAQLAEHKKKEQEAKLKEETEQIAKEAREAQAKAIDDNKDEETAKKTSHDQATVQKGVDHAESPSTPDSIEQIPSAHVGQSAPKNPPSEKPNSREDIEANLKKKMARQVKNDRTIQSHSGRSAGASSSVSQLSSERRLDDAMDNGVVESKTSTSAESISTQEKDGKVKKDETKGDK